MVRRHTTSLMHFTHVTHLESIVQRGLMADSMAHKPGMLSVEIGHIRIKERRRRRSVPIPPGGVVADYVPFYYAPRSPMMFAIEHGNVDTYSDGCDQLIYLVTTVDRLMAHGSAVVFTDRNAALAIARFTSDPADLDGLIDWPLMQEKYWRSTPDDPDRHERRMAECLVHQQVPWEGFCEVVTRSKTTEVRASRALASLGVEIPVVVRPEWYF